VVAIVHDEIYRLKATVTTLRMQVKGLAYELRMRDIRLAEKDRRIAELERRVQELTKQAAGSAGACPRHTAPQRGRRHRLGQAGEPD